MSLKLTHQSITQARDDLRRKRLEIMAQIEQWKREADSLFTLESDMTRLLDQMQMQARLHAGTEARQ